MSTSETGKKICVVCGKDVAGQPRVKDAKGRYLCAGECQQKALAAAKAKAAGRSPSSAPASSGPVPPAIPVAKADGGNLLNNLIDQSPMLKAVTCESCGNPMPAGAVICTRCGFNTQTGKALRTAVVVEKVKNEPKVKVPGGSGNKYAASVGPGFWKSLLIYSCILSALSLLVFAGPMGVWAARVIFLIAGLIAWIMCVISAFKNDQTLWGILQIIPCVNVIAMLVFNIFFNEDSMSRALYWSLWIGGFMFAVIVAVAIALGINIDLTSTSLSPV